MIECKGQGGMYDEATDTPSLSGRSIRVNVGGWRVSADLDAVGRCEYICKIQQLSTLGPRKDQEATKRREYKGSAGNERYLAG